eukprot:TRINITY_DN160_c0_g2_i1.p1 TRINITY_DN160_c0_g2~~TRINITY_DN160_c0_g2_i1.p1  ORF type:complete len:902 (+),score=113.29 TRINITY_DN160_c0_g2_i1:22511-25216(+)
MCTPDNLRQVPSSVYETDPQFLNIMMEGNYAIKIPARASSFCFVNLCTVNSFQFGSSPGQASTNRIRYSIRCPNRSLFPSTTFLRPCFFPLSAHSQNESNASKPRCTLIQGNANRTVESGNRLKAENWTERIQIGSVLEVWRKGEVRFAYVASILEKAIGVNLVQISNADSWALEESKISLGEVISVWPRSITPSSSKALASAVQMGLNFLRNSPPRSLDLSNTYSNMRKIPKSSPKALRDSYQIALSQFPLSPSAGRNHRAAVTAAASILLASDTSRFKRAAPGSGWRALPRSVVESRSRCSFVDVCNTILENPSNSDLRHPAAWSGEQLDILREIELVAAGGGNAKGKAAAALESLGYHPTDDGATHLLLDLEFWSTGAQQNNDENLVSAPGSSTDNSPGEPKFANREWAFPPSILDDAREIRSASRKKRALLYKQESRREPIQRRRLLQAEGQQRIKAYCIDDKSSRFLDDAFSIQLHDNGKRARFLLHVTDVDEVVKPGSPIDELARERAMSLYLPLRPLHMLPAAAMDAVSFSPSLPTKAVTVQIDIELESESILAWDIFPSIVPPVKRVSYKQFDAILSKSAEAWDVREDEVEDLRLMANIAPCLANKLDSRRLRRKREAHSREVDGIAASEGSVMESKSIASVRLVKPKDKSSSKSVRVARVVDFQSSGAHGVVDDILTSAGSLIRQFAKQNKVSLPEGRDAASYVARCGTAPLRRYADLTIQRQIKSVLFGKQPAGRRQMAELRGWLAKRHSAAEKTVTERRKNALFESFSAHCAQQSAVSGNKFAVVKGRVRNTYLTKSATLRMDLSLEGTGLSTIATVSGKLLADILKLSHSTENNGVEQGAKKKSATDRDRMILSAAKSLVAPGSRVWVQILKIDTSARTIDGTAVELLK